MCQSGMKLQWLLWQKTKKKIHKFCFCSFDSCFSIESAHKRQQLISYLTVHSWLQCDYVTCCHTAVPSSLCSAKRETVQRPDFNWTSLPTLAHANNYLNIVCDHQLCPNQQYPHTCTSSVAPGIWRLKSAPQCR